MLSGDRRQDTPSHKESSNLQNDNFDNDGDPFGDEAGGEVKYRTLNWWQAGLLMIAETISIGVLSLPSALAAVGIVPGMILMVGLGILTWYTGYVLGQFKERYPSVHSMADVGFILGGKIGREFLGALQVIYLLFILASHVLTFTIALNVITGHATCTIVWGIVGLVLYIILTIPRTLKNVSYFALTAFISIITAILITMIALGVEAPNPKPIAVTRVTSFVTAFGAVGNIVVAYAGHVTFFQIISELKDPRDFPKALAFLQISAIVIYSIAAAIIYAYAGAGVASPALGSTSPVVSKVAYGIALVTILAAGAVPGHLIAKYIYVRIFRNTKHMSETTFLSVGTWLVIIVILWVIAWIIAESIPGFNNLLNLIASLFGSWFSYAISGVLWLFLNKGLWFSGYRKTLLTLINTAIVGIGVAIAALGLWTSGVRIHAESGGHSWSCANNA